MATTVDFKDVLDIPFWRLESPTIGASAAGVSMCNDLRNNEDRIPYLFLLRGNTTLEAFDPTTSDWMPLVSPALAGTFGAGAVTVFHPSQGPRGTIAAGATTTSVTLTTALPAAVGVNRLANCGAGKGFKIRIIDNGAGGSGKIEERYISANTSGTTPVLTLDSALSFTPVTGSNYEILSGRIFCLGAATLAAGIWKYVDFACNVASSNLATTNLPATIGTDSEAIAMSELHVPYSRKPGEGFVPGSSTYNGGLLNCVLATGTPTSTTLQGTSTNSLRTNEYANFQIRVVEDTTNTTAVGQRRRIASHTSGLTPNFTVSSAWTVTPSVDAKFVIENDDDRILVRSSATTASYIYNIAANTWDSTTVPASGGAVGAGLILGQSFSIDWDTTGNARHSFIYSFRGGATATLDVLDWSTMTWTNAAPYGNSAQTFTTGTCATHGTATKQGRFLHININGGQRTARFDMEHRILDPGTYLKLVQGTAVVGRKMATALFVDGSTKLGQLYVLGNTSSVLMSMTVQK